MLPLVLRGSPIASFGNSTVPSQHLPELPAFGTLAVGFYELKEVSFVLSLAHRSGAFSSCGRSTSLNPVSASQQKLPEECH